jgi:hypothetical protein
MGILQRFDKIKLKLERKVKEGGKESRGWGRGRKKRGEKDNSPKINSSLYFLFIQF